VIRLCAASITLGSVRPSHCPGAPLERTAARSQELRGHGACLPDQSYHVVLAVKACARLDAVLASALRAALTAALRRGGSSLQANPPAEEEETVMRTSRSAPRFAVRSPSGAVTPAMPSFSSSFVEHIGGHYVEVDDEAVIVAALRILARRLSRGTALTNPRATREYLAMRFASLEHEVFVCLFLDNRRRLIACEELFRGTIDGASVHPREVVKRALHHNAAAVILAHNHPSGIAEPSQADEFITRRLREALGLIDVRVLDHLIVGGAVVESMAERGLL
jgi:DNA repair protein RadC